MQSKPFSSWTIQDRFTTQTIPARDNVPCYFPGDSLNNQPLLEHRYRGETLLRTLWLLFASDHIHLFSAACVFIVKHIPVWLLPLLTANIIDIVVQHRPIAELWRNVLDLDMEGNTG